MAITQHIIDQCRASIDEIRKARKEMDENPSYEASIAWKAACVNFDDNVATVANVDSLLQEIDHLQKLNALTSSLLRKCTRNNKK